MAPTVESVALSKDGTEMKAQKEPSSRQRCSPSKGKTFFCDLCYRRYRDPSGLKRHYHQEHLSVGKKLICELCHFQAHTKAEMKQHESIHFRDQKWNCDQCSSIHPSERCLKRHIRQTHKTTKLFNCHICSYQTKVKAQLPRHIATHVTKEKLFKCLHPSCKYTGKTK